MVRKCPGRCWLTARAVHHSRRAGQVATVWKANPKILQAMLMVRYSAVFTDLDEYQVIGRIEFVDTKLEGIKKKLLDSKIERNYDILEAVK